MLSIRRFAGLAGLAFGLMAVNVQAFVPSTGIWWNSTESGRGFNIEIQYSIMTVTHFVFDASGNATWYTSAGTYNETTHRFSGTLDAATQGQCFGCNYKTPIRTSNKGGAISPLLSLREHAHYPL
jgi:hypothetical protein